MTKRKTHKTPVATLGATSRDEIKEVLDEVARDILKNFGGKKAIPGWHILFGGAVNELQVGQARIITLTDERASKLTKLAETDYGAFDAACYLAGTLFGIGHLTETTACPLALRIFGGRVLRGEITRPVCKGGKRVDDVPLRAFQYRLCRFVADLAPLPLTRNRQPSGPPSFTACDAVAEAFALAGYPATYERMASLCYDTAHSDIRALADALGLLKTSDV